MGGHSNSTGFVIREKSQEITIKSKGFKEGFWDKKPGLVINAIFFGALKLAIMVVMVFFLIKFSPHPFLINLFLGIICGFGAICFMDFVLRFLVSVLIIKKHNLREYHACEHKVINLLQSEEMLWAMAEKKDMPVYFWGVVEKQITIENLLKESPIHPGCGSGPWFVQKYFSTKEPSREKLEEALGVALEYCRQL